MKAGDEKLSVEVKAKRESGKEHVYGTPSGSLKFGTRCGAAERIGITEETEEIG